MDGRWLALGTVAAIAAVGRVRRGQRALREPYWTDWYQIVLTQSLLLDGQWRLSTHTVDRVVLGSAPDLDAARHHFDVSASFLTRVADEYTGPVDPDAPFRTPHNLTTDPQAGKSRRLDLVIFDVRGGLALPAPCQTILWGTYYEDLADVSLKLARAWKEGRRSLRELGRRP